MHAIAADNNSTSLSSSSTSSGGAENAGVENAGVENAGVDKVWKAVRIKYSYVSANWGGIKTCMQTAEMPRWCRVVINAFVSRALTKCTIKDEAVLFAARLSTCCCVCTNCN